MQLVVVNPEVASNAIDALHVLMFCLHPCLPFWPAHKAEAEQERVQRIAGYFRINLELPVPILKILKVNFEERNKEL